MTLFPRVYPVLILGDRLLNLQQKHFYFGILIGLACNNPTPPRETVWPLRRSALRMRIANTGLRNIAYELRV
jgi:hypothetical protein